MAAYVTRGLGLWIGRWDVKRDGWIEFREDNTGVRFLCFYQNWTISFISIPHNPNIISTKPKPI